MAKRKCSFRFLIYQPGSDGAMSVTQDARRRRNVVTSRHWITLQGKSPTNVARLCGASVIVRLKKLRATG